MPNRRFLHIRQLLEAWSQATPFLIPTPRGSNVLIHSTINLDKKLGCGAFGEVFKGQYKAVGSTNPPIEVAVKRILGNAKRKQIQEFCNEAQIMTVLQHENIVAFYGFASLEEPIMVVMELVTGGDLRVCSFLPWFLKHYIFRSTSRPLKTFQNYKSCGLQ